MLLEVINVFNPEVWLVYTLRSACHFTYANVCVHLHSRQPKPELPENQQTQKKKMA